MKMVCYCADDYALNNQISDAVCMLLQKNAIQATSCMTQSPFWNEHANKLLQLQNESIHLFEIGLHVNFTHTFDSRENLHFSLSELMQKAWLRTLNQKEIKYSIEQQWNLFTETMGKAPDFIDGHQHVHQFPVIRDVLFSFLKEKNFKGWIRNLNHTISVPKYKFKNKVLEFLGADATYKLGQKNHISSNPYFSGIYDFNHTNYAELTRLWLNKAQNKTLIMCHPATHQSNQSDEIQNARVHEYQYLNSDQFIQDCQDFNIQLKPMGTML